MKMIMYHAFSAVRPDQTTHRMDASGSQSHHFPARQHCCCAEVLDTQHSSCDGQLLLRLQAVEDADDMHKACHPRKRDCYPDYCILVICRGHYYLF